eukprot:TRINITY_DN788_c2_g2_i1.p1 TRINITY_DN788_c2_g2~~TRINITY_DN788_c2_g2_i1.p1  ORF type:complete len:162 (+),score=7.35 TRINITY_DN788_c2_g2_i1:140-625(+)
MRNLVCPLQTQFLTSSAKKLVNLEPLNLTLNLPLVFLTFNTILTIIRTHEDLTTVVFVVFTYVGFMVLLWCLDSFNRTAEISPEKEKLKLPIWVLSSSLLLVFAYRVSEILSPVTFVLVWAIAIASSLSGFYLFFIYRDDKASKTKSLDSTREFSPPMPKP